MAGLRGEERGWVRGAQAGSLSDLESLFREYWPRAHRAAYLVVHDPAEDITQEAFLAAIRSLDRFDRGRAFGPWLHGIVVNRAIDWARSRALRAEVVDGGLAAVEDGEHARTGFSPAIVAALAGLSAELRAVIVLRYLLEYTQAEIADLLELPRGTVNSRLRRALYDLTDRLEEERP